MSVGVGDVIRNTRKYFNYNVAGWSWAVESEWDKGNRRAATEMELELAPLKEFRAECGNLPI